MGARNDDVDSAVVRESQEKRFMHQRAGVAVCGTDVHRQRCTGALERRQSIIGMDEVWMDLKIARHALCCQGLHNRICTQSLAALG
jgi:hypothetical protein